jgi:porin
MVSIRAGLMLAVFAAPTWASEEPCDGCVDEAALAIDATYTGELWHQASGGVAEGQRYLDNLDLTLDADAGRLFGAEGLQFFAYVLYNNGHGLCDDLVGSAQCVSNIEATDALRLYELWMQWSFGQGEQSVKFGLYDLNSEFDSIESAGLFINPSHGIGPDFSQTGENGPSIFPVTSLAVRAHKSFGALSAQVAVLDGVPGDPDHPDRTVIELSGEEGTLVVGEANYHFDSGARVGAGYWQYTSEFDDLIATDAAGEASRRDDNAGAYAIFESAKLLASSTRGELDFFVRAGYAQTHINAIGRYLGAGAVYETSVAERLHSFGAAVGVAELGAPFRRAQSEVGIATTRREYSGELTYRISVSDWLAVQSDLQYTRNPGMNPDLASGWTVGLRFEIARGWAW